MFLPAVRARLLDIVSTTGCRSGSLLPSFSFAAAGPRRSVHSVAVAAQRIAGAAPRFPGTTAQFGLRSLTTAPVLLGRARPSGGGNRRKREEEEEAKPSGLFQFKKSEQDSAPAEVEPPNFHDGSRVAKKGESQIDVLHNKAAVKHMVSVYSTNASMMALAGTASAVSLATGAVYMIPFGPIIPVLGSLIPLYMFMKTDLTTSPGKRIALLGSFVGLTGMSLAPLLAMSFALNPMAVPMALGGTGAIFLGATGVSLLAPRGSLLRFGPALGGGALALLGLGLVGMVYPSPLLFTVYPYLGIGLFTAFLGYNTQNIVEKFRAGDRDHLKHSVDIFIDLIGIFRMLLMMFGLGGSRD